MTPKNKTDSSNRQTRICENNGTQDAELCAVNGNVAKPWDKLQSTRDKVVTAAEVAALVDGHHQGVAEPHWTRTVQRSITQSTLTALNPCSPETYHTIQAHCTEPAQSRDLSHNPCSPDLSHIHTHCTEPVQSSNLSDVHAHQIYHTIHAQSCFYVYSTHNTKTLLASDSEHKGCCVPSDSSCWIDWLNELRFHIRLDAKQVILNKKIWRRSPSQSLGLV